MALKHQSQHDHSVHKAEKPQNLKNIIHDINNSLMLIGIAIDELERHDGGKRTMGHSAACPKSLSAGNASQIVRRHIKQIGLLLQEAARCAPNAADADVRPSQSFELLSYDMLAAFFESQRQEWSLIAPPQSQMSVCLVPFEGVVLASRPHMMRLFQNLVRNACEAYHQMADKKHPLCLSLMGRPNQQGLVIELSDNGPGMDEAVARQIFTPHFTTKRQAAFATGLGLSNANALAKAMGGTLTLKDTSAQGSAFVLYLPYLLSPR